MRLRLAELADRGLERGGVIEVGFVEGEVARVREASGHGDECGVKAVRELVGADWAHTVLRVLVAELLDILPREGLRLRRGAVVGLFGIGAVVVCIVSCVLQIAELHTRFLGSLYPPDMGWCIGQVRRVFLSQRRHALIRCQQ